MLVPGDHHHLHFGFWWLGLVLLVFLVIGFVIRRKWRLAVARKEEIKRLLMLASEEAARAELEASAGYYRSGSGSGSVSASASVSVFVSSSPPFQCAVCYSPTTTRCARCKSVRYCSGKCQIIHWRQGHKEECYPSSITHQIIGDGSNSSQNAVKQEQRGTYGNDFETDGGQSTKPIETFIEEPVFGNSPEVPCVKKDDDIKVELPADAKSTTSTSKSSTTSFSAGFSTSTTSSESFDDVSVAESIGSNDLEKLYEHQNVDIAFDTVETACSVNNVDHTGPPSAEFISLVNDVYSSNSSCKLNQIKSSGSGGETRHRSSSFSGLSVNDSKDGSVVEPSTASHGFWGKTLESSWSRNDALNDTSQSNFTGAGDGDISDSRSFLHFSFNLSGSTIPPLQSQGSETNVNVLDDTHLASLEINNPIDGAALSKKINTDTPKFEQSPPSNSERSNHMNNGATTDSHKLRPKEVRSRSSSASYSHPSCSAGGELTGTDASKVTSMPSLSTKRSNHVVNGTSSTSHLLKSREVGSLSSASVAHSSSSNGGHSVPSLRSGKVDGIQAIATNSSQIGSYSPNASNGLKSSMWKVVDQFKASKLSKHSLGVGSETLGRYSDKGLFSYELFVKLYIWNKVELRPCGLTNCGNSCYANVVLQCLAFTPPLTAYLLQGFHSKACVKKEWCFTCEFESLILKAKEGNSPLSPKGILSQLSNIGSHLGNGRQEDAHEFLRYAIDTMQSVCLKEAGVNASSSLEEETTLIGLTFGGYLRSKIRCMKCRVKSERHERMMDLTVEIEGDIGTLDEALRQFTRTEILDGENKYRCNRCKSYEKAKKKLTVLEAPNVLTIALKRFQSGKFGKLNKSIEFPEILNLAPYMSGTSDKSPIYRLYGVVVHLDIMNAAFSGHYVCYVKNNQNKWFKIDDSSVKTVELERVLKKGAYMLLYTRCSPRAPRSIRNSLSRDPKIKIASSKLGVPSTVPSVFQSYPSSIPLDGPANLESSYSRLPMETIFEADSSSDSFSLFSSCSDEGSCSTESTRDSTSIDDLSDCILGDSGRSWKSPWRNSADSDTSSSSSSSPLYSRHSPLVDQEHSREPTGSQTDYADLVVEGDGLWARLRSGGSGLEDSEGKGSTPFLHSDMTKHCRKLDSISSCRETDSERLGWVNPFDNVKFGVSRRRSTRERTD